ncbi:MAG: hypothetical protein IJ899_00950 [Blautia sp.]|nr:hypothetical protein [Blautia sp.]
MNIVRSLAGYSLGRSDLVRRAMSKKKASVMLKERQNFVYGNPDEGVPGCVANGIPEKVANKIYDDMTDFAKYAFNKSHAACYAVVAYQTAYLKLYYPVEFMAALMTSVIDVASKVSEYIQVCRQMKIRILSPDVNTGDYAFTADGDAIRYGLSAIKSVGRPVIEALVAERAAHGQYRSFQDFIERNTQLNKRAIENFIKAGAVDSLEGNRRQKMLVYPQLCDQAAQNKKRAVSGQISLFDFAPEAARASLSVKMPNLPEFAPEEILAFEKEVLGIYLSGHPLEKHRAVMEKMITARTTDFLQDEETGLPKVTDQSRVIVGGMITEKTIKYTKNNQIMAFLTLEDLVGSVEVIVFPKSYEQYGRKMEEDARVFIEGRVSVEEDKPSKLILEKMRLFDEMPKEIWFQFESKEAYAQRQEELMADLKASPGSEGAVIYLRDVRAIKRLPAALSVQLDDVWLAAMQKKYGEENVKVMEKALKTL